MYGTFTLTGRNTTPSGRAHTGQVIVTANTTIRDTAGNVVMSGSEAVPLDETGAWSLVLPCDSPELNPSTGIGYRVGYELRAAAMQSQSFYATADMAGSTLDVSDIVSVSLPTPLSAIVGPAGPSTPEATADTAGKVRLSGDLGGTADAPIVPALADKVGVSDPRLTDDRTPLPHMHPTAQVTGLDTVLAGKVDTADPRLTDARTPLAHAHPVSDVTGLSTTLATLMPTSSVNGAIDTYVASGASAAMQKYYDDAGTFAPRGSVLTISRNVAGPSGLQPTVWVNVSGKGDNTTFKGVAAGQFLARDRSDVTAANKGVIYGIQAVVAPIVDRNNVPFDDCVGISIENQGSGVGTDALYFGKNRSDKATNPSAIDWSNVIQNDANAGTFIRTLGTHDVGISFGASTITTTAIRLGNNQSISSNKADGSLKHLFRLTAAGTFRIAESAGGLDIRDAFGGMYANAKIVMPNDTPIFGVRFGVTNEYEMVRITTGDNLALFAARATVLAGGGMVLQNTTTVPSTPVGGVVIYAEAGVLKAKTPAGTVTTLAS